MNRLRVLGLVILVALIFTLSGCPPPQSCIDCTKYSAQDDLDIGRLEDTFEQCEACRQEIVAEMIRDKCEIRHKTLRSKITDKALAMAKAHFGTGQTLRQHEKAIKTLQEKQRYDDEIGRISNQLVQFRKQKQQLRRKRLRAQQNTNGPMQYKLSAPRRLSIRTMRA